MRSLEASTTYSVPFSTSVAPDALPVATAYADATSLGAMTVALATGTNAYSVAVVLPSNVTEGQIITVAIDWLVDTVAKSTARLLVGQVGYTEMVANATKTAMEEAGSKLAVLYADWLDGGRLDLILDAVNAKSALITTGSVTVASPVAADGTTITVVQGDDYSGSSAITWTGTSEDQWPDLTDATLAFRATMMGAAPVVGVPTVTTPTGTQVFTLSLTDTQTATPVGRYRYDVEATLSGGAILTLLRGAFVVTRTYTNEP